MRLNTTVILTVVLLLLMSGAGTASALFGFRMGREALKTVRQPDVSPTRKFAGDQQVASGKDGLEIISEREILVRVYDYVHAQKNGKPVEDQEASNTEFIESEGENSEKASSDAQTETPDPKLNLPVTSQDGGVTIEVVNASQEDGSLLLKVNMKNEGDKAVRFLYSFLEVKDEDGRALSAITDGLPGELPATGQDFSGTVKIPTALLNDAETVSLTLTDYPDQKLQLSLTEIPVVR